ncbi:c-type cytochrome [Plastorhodobacter daqingensis]|uniref:C-type cytochrome n=1 Tax=Plastorhodobacter daqingensis TaxID=1387281 RepID=A0ABW2UKB9_9RHOB
MQIQHVALIALGTVLAIAGCSEGRRNVDGHTLYTDYCAACHGDSGRGDGHLAASLTPPPADLTTLSARNGGQFPMLAMMAKVYGYAEGRGGGGGPMPEFGPLLQGELILIETEDGLVTPTPEKLVALADHVRSLQR